MHLNSVSLKNNEYEKTLPKQHINTGNDSNLIPTETPERLTITGTTKAFKIALTSVIVSNFLTALFATFKDSSVPLYERIFFVNFLYSSTKYITTAITEKIGNGDKKAFIVSSNLKTLYTVSKNQLAIIGTTKINVQ